MMRLSKTRLSEIESLSDGTIDISEIPELDDDFWEVLIGLSLKITSKLNLRY